MSKRVSPLLTTLAAALVSTTAFTGSAHSQTWQGAQDANWGVSTNWNPNDVPNTATETATFSTPGNRNNLEADHTINGIVATGSFTINSNVGARLTLAGTNPTINVSPGWSLNFNVVSTAAVVVTKTGNGFWTLNNELTGSVLVLNGTLNFGNLTVPTPSTGGVTGNVELAGTSSFTMPSHIPGSYRIGSLTGSPSTTVSLGRDLEIGSGNYAGTISGPGNLLKSGSGALTLSGANTFSGTTTVNGGALLINGTHSSAVTVNAGGVIGGTGTIASIAAIGGAVAPGNSVGTLTTTGNVTLDAASSFAVEVDGTTSDRLVVGGTANFNGATVVVTAPGNNGQATTYRIVDAAVIATGFNPVVSEALIAFDASLIQTANAVDLVLIRNNSTFQQTGQTPNQSATAGAVDALGGGNAVNAAIAGNYTGNNALFDEISGESFATQQTVLAQRSQSVREAVFDRVDAAFAALGVTSDEVSSYAFANSGGSHATEERAIWGALAGRGGVINATSNTAAVDTRSAGVTLGLDGLVGDWRLGAMLHAGTSSAAESALNASSRSTDVGFGVYGGGDLGIVQLTVGADFERHAINSTRNVTVPGFVQTLTASYGGSTAQAFAELSADLDLNRVTLTPFANVALVNVTTDPFTEAGGPAALSSAASNNSYAFTTLGARGEVKLAMDHGVLVTAHGGLGWQHVFGNTPSATNAFAGGSAFNVAGAPLATDAAVLEAGLMFDVNETMQFGLNYNGQLATTGQSHAVKATLSGTF